MITLLDRIFAPLAPHQCIGCSKDGPLLCTECTALLPALQSQCYRCHKLTDEFRVCSSCRRHSHLRSIYVRTSYDGVGEALITALKFDHVVAAAKVIAESMELHIPAKAVLVPVPTATSRVRQRGYDQSVLIATRLRRRYGTERKLLLRRYGQTRQTGSTRAERLQQLHDGFGVIKTKNPPERVLLVDDVLTTGATLEAAAKVLKHAGVKQIDALVFARAQ